MLDYWNHNTAYHQWILRVAQSAHVQDVLDVGCGDGLLLQRIAPHVTNAVGIEPDEDAFAHARTRLQRVSNVELRHTNFQSFHLREEGFDLISFVAALHHMELRPSLEKAKRLLRPGGELRVVGIAANENIVDWVFSAAALPLVKVSSRLHNETPDIGVPTTNADESLEHVRRVSGEIFPGRKLRRGLYYRYLLSWQKPFDARTSPQI